MQFKNQRDIVREQQRQSLLTFYTTTPQEELNLEEFVTLGVYRKQMMKKLHEITTKHSLQTKLELQASKDDLKSQTPTFPQSSMNKKQPDSDISLFLNEKLEEKENLPTYDTISHYILLLSACDSDQRRQEFIRDESTLFKWRAKGIGDNSLLLSFAQTHGLQLDPFNFHDEYARYNQSPHINPGFKPKGEMIKYFLERLGITNAPTQLQLYSLSFAAVLDLFCQDKTKVVVLQGKAYISQHSLVEILVKMYRDLLDRKLTKTKDHFDYIKSQHSLLPSLLRKIQFGDDPQAQINADCITTDEITKETLPQLVPKSFPLCMQRLYNHVQREHHVRHHGRGQLNLFFKGIGLPLDQALDWWRAMFAPKYPGDKFDKEYKYNFRHNYGAEGKRADYSAPGCERIISSEVGATDAHGCPFKHLSGKDPNAFKIMLQNSLKQSVEDPSIRDKYIVELLELCSDGHYQFACKMLFNYTHNNTMPSENIKHPTQYFRKSRDHYQSLKEQQEEKEKKDAPPGTKEDVKILE